MKRTELVKRAKRKRKWRAFKNKAINLAGGVLGTYAVYCVIGLILGTLVGLTSYTKPYNTCEYSNIFTASNAGYYLSCELFRKRWR